MTGNRCWDSHTALPALGQDDTIVLHFPLDGLGDAATSCLATLNGVERMRAARFRRVIHQERFSIGRAMLRVILGHFLELSPAAVEFSYGEHGKPVLQSLSAVKGLQFNLSHSGSEALCAVSWNGALGVDIESHKKRVSIEAIARRFFAPEESIYLNALAEDVRIRAFYQLWTAKEALLKGIGGGLTLPLDRWCFDLETVPFGLNALGDSSSGAGSGWTVYPLFPAEGFSAALAVSNPQTAHRYIRCDASLCVTLLEHVQKFP